MCVRVLVWHLSPRIRVLERTPFRTVVWMFAFEFVQFLGWSLAVAATATALPQLVHLLRNDSTAGVSLRSAVLATVGSFAWLCFTVSVRDIPAIASSAGPLLVWSSIWFMVAKRQAVLRRSSVQLAVGVLLVVVAAATRTSEVVAVASSLTWMLPQLRTAFKEDDLSGVSPFAYGFLGLEALAWMLYAVLTGHLAYGVAPLVQAPVALAVMCLSISSRRSVRRSMQALPGSLSSYAVPAALDLDEEFELLLTPLVDMHHTEHVAPPAPSRVSLGGCSDPARMGEQVRPHPAVV